MLLVVLNQIGSHLQRAIQRYIKSQLLTKSSLYLSVRFISHEFQFCIENTRSIIHRTTNQTVERKQSCVERFATAECFIFRSTSRLVTNQVRISATKSRRAYCFMSIDANLIIGSFGHSIKVVVIHPLTVMMFATGNHIAYITTLHSIVAVVYHKLVSFIHVAFVVAHGSGSFMVHHQFHAFALGIVIQHLHIKVRIRSHKVEYIIFGVAEPVFPTFVPAFHQYLVKTILGSKVNVTFHIFISSTMLTIGFGLVVIRFTQFYGRKIIRISPSALTGNHFPPYAYIFHRFNPGNIFVSTRFVQVQCQLGSQNITSVITYHNRTPRGFAGSLQVAFVSLRIGSQPRFEDKILIIQIKMHT